MTQDQGGASSGSGGSAGGAGGAGGTSGSGGVFDAGSGPGVYSAFNLLTHVPRFVLFKADPARDVCFRIWVEMIGPGLPIEVTAPWSAGHAEVTKHASDCAVTNGYPVQPADSASAISGSGTLVVEGGFPCSVTFHGSLTFDPQESWIPVTEPLDVDALPVDGGCG